MEMRTEPMTINVDLENKTISPLGNYLDCLSNLKTITTNCTTHVHLNVETPWTDTQVKRWLTLGLLLEPRVMNYVARSATHREAKVYTIGSVYTDSELSRQDPIGQVMRRKAANHKRYAWLNLIEIKREGGIGTVEVRALPATTDTEIVTGWIRLWAFAAAVVATKTTTQIRAMVNEGAFDDLFPAIPEGSEVEPDPEE